VSGKSRRARLFGRILRMPAVLDRKGTRWMIQVLSPPPRVLVLVNRGRKSGRLYKTPLSMLAEDPERGEVFVSPMWSRDSDWYQNVIAGGLVEIHVRGEKRQVEWRELDEAEGRARGEAFRDAHPIYSRMILRRLARLNGLEGEPAEAVVRNLRYRAYTSAADSREKRKPEGPLVSEAARVGPIQRESRSRPARRASLPASSEFEQRPGRAIRRVKRQSTAGFVGPGARGAKPPPVGGRFTRRGEAKFAPTT
jgi:deazaflavin-dependent oxidoreductase (nitroreductase family)